MKTIKTISYFLAFLLAFSCSSTHITSTWKAPNTVARSYNKIMVLGIILEADRTIRERMEKHLVDDLKSRGYKAFSAFEVYGPKAFDGFNEKQANEKLANDGIDAVITVVLLDKQKERYYVPGRMVFTPYNYYRSHFWGYYSSIQYRIESPNYYEVTTRYFWESNLYDLNTKQLVFSVQTQSFEPASTESLAHEYGQKILQSMEKNNILQKQEPEKLKAM